jgi:hypothetical protein
MSKLVPYVEVGADGTKTGFLDRSAIPGLLATGQVPDSAVTSDDS